MSSISALVAAPGFSRKTGTPAAMHVMATAAYDSGGTDATTASATPLVTMAATSSKASGAPHAPAASSALDRVLAHTAASSSPAGRRAGYNDVVAWRPQPTNPIRIACMIIRQDGC